MALCDLVLREPDRQHRKNKKIHGPQVNERVHLRDVQDDRSTHRAKYFDGTNAVNRYVAVAGAAGCSQAVGSEVVSVGRQF